eukprot:4638057-Pleurochrysis_carterae.AAC.1
MGNQARVADKSTVVSTSTRNFPNRRKSVLPLPTEHRQKHGQVEQRAQNLSQRAGACGAGRNTSLRRGLVWSVSGFALSSPTPHPPGATPPDPRANP